MKWIIITDLPNPDHNIVLRVADDEFNKALSIAKKVVLNSKYGKSFTNDDPDFGWKLDSAITDHFGRHDIKYERHTSIPERSTQELDEACDEYWIFFDQIDEEGEQ